MRYLCLLIPSMLLAAPPTKLQVQGTPTAQQAILSWDQTYAGTCTIEVSESATYSPVVNDVNATLFTGSATTAAGVGAHTFIVGKRTSESSTDGKFYSRSLAAATPHYVRLTCDGEYAYLTFTTRPVSGIVPEAPLWDSSALGNAPTPSWDWTDRTKPVIDPQTGTKMYRGNDPDEFGFTAEYSFAADSVMGASGWTNAQDLASGVVGTRATTGNTNYAFIPMLVDSGNRTFGGFAINLYAFGLSNAAFRTYCEGSDGTDTNRQLAVSMSVDSGQSAFTDEIIVTCPQTTAADIGLAPADYPDPGFAGWSKSIPSNLRMSYGYVTATASSTVTLVGGLNSSSSLAGSQAATGWFRQEWAAGSKIFITGTHPTCANNYCTLVSVTDQDTMVIAETITVAAALYKSANFGFRVRKTNATGTVSVSMKYANQAFRILSQGQAQSCSARSVSTTVDRTGAPLGYTATGYLCLFSLFRDDATRLYFIDAEHADFRLLSMIPAPSSISGYGTDDLPTGGGFSAGPSAAGGAFDQVNANRFYLVRTTQASGNPAALWSVTYNDALQYVEPAGIRNSYNVAGAISGYTDPLIWVNLTKPSESRSITQQILAQTTYNTAYWPSLSGLTLGGVSSGFAQMWILLGGQNLPGASFLFQLSDGAFSSWTDGLSNALPGNRFVGMHSTGAGYGYNIISSHSLVSGNSAIKSGGPFSSLWSCVYKGGVCDADTYIPGTIGAGFGYDATCPTGLPDWAVAIGATGDQCVTMETEGEPCSATPQATELALFPCPHDAAKSWIGTAVEPKDTIYDNADSNPEQVDQLEYLTLVKKEDVGGGVFRMTFLRDSSTGYNCQATNPRGRTCVGAAFQDVHLNGWSARWTPNGQYPAYTFSTQAWAPENQYLTRGHMDRSLSSAGVPSFVGIAGFGGFFARNGGAIGSQASAYFSQYPPFAGIASDADGASGWQQSYISAAAEDASGANALIGMDWRHLNSSAGSEAEAMGATLGDAYTLTLESGTSSVYKVSTISGEYNPKKTQIAGWVGQYGLGEKSSAAQGDVLTDADEWRVCYAYADDECRDGSTAGDFFIVAPGLDTSRVQCNPSQISNRVLCLFAATAISGNAVQMGLFNDPDGIYQRTVGKNLTPLGAQYAYSHVRPYPTGKCYFASQYQYDHYWSGVVMGCPGQFTNDTANRTGFQPVAVKANHTSWYVKFGLNDSFECTPRAEACQTASATIDATTPFLFASESITPVSGAGTVTFPAIPGRIYHYAVVANGVTGPMQKVAIP